MLNSDTTMPKTVNKVCMALVDNVTRRKAERGKMTEHKLILIRAFRHLTVEQETSGG
jgi:hypothetical protein